MEIELLPEHIIDQIKAGEVLERPSSLLKELIENSIDAHSTEISIHILDNGLSLLSIEDNGDGINFSNLPKAFLRHATSKIKRFEDLYSLNSYGFRGEALASLAASARVTCVSQPLNLNESGGKLIINGGLTELITPQQLNKKGTAFFIKDLFYNTPARLKFIKSKISEKIQLKKIIYSFVLSHPEIQFTIKWDDKEKDFFKIQDNFDLTKRIESTLPKNLHLLFAEESYMNYKVKIFFTKEASKNSTHKHQFLFVNARYFQDKSLHQAIIRNLDSLWSYGESGHYIVIIETPPDAIDVNVHPNKTQIKFLESDTVFSLLVTAIRTALQSIARPYIPLTNEATSLFTHDVSQFSSVQLSSPDSYNQHSQSLQQNEDSSFIIVDNSFCIIQKESFYFIINLQNLMIEVLLSLVEECLTNEENVSPLLVSEPFQVKNNTLDKSFEQIKKLGFEFDRLSSDVIILRTIPKNLPRATFRFFI